MMSVYDVISAEQHAIQTKAEEIADGTMALFEMIRDTYADDQCLMTRMAVDLSNDANMLLTILKDCPANNPPTPPARADED